MAAAYDGPDRRHHKDELSWDQVENRLRRILDEKLDQLKMEIYERSFDPLKERVDMQDRYCAQHSQQLTETTTLLSEMVDAHLIRRMEVAEARLSLIGKSTVVIGTIAGTALGGIIVALLTHSIQL